MSGFSTTPRARTRRFVVLWCVFCAVVFLAGISATVHRNLRDRALARKVTELEENAVEMDRKGNTEAAVASLRKAIRLRKQLGQRATRETAESLGALGRLLSEGGKDSEACSAWLESIRIWRSMGLGESLDCAAALTSIADLKAEQGQYKAALALYGQARPMLGKEKKGTVAAKTLSHEATVRRRLGQYRKAEALYREALRICTRKAPKDSVLCAAIEIGLGSLYTELHDFGQAESLYADAQAMLGGESAVASPTYVDLLVGLAELERAEGKCEDSLDRLQEARRICERGPRTVRNRLDAVLNDLGLAYLCKGAIADAASVLQRAARLTKAAEGENHPAYFLTMGNLADAHAALGKTRVAVSERILGRRRPEVADRLERLAFVLRKLGRLAEAKRAEQRAIRLRRQSERVSPTGCVSVDDGSAQWESATKPLGRSGLAPRLNACVRRGSCESRRTSRTRCVRNSGRKEQ